MKYSKVTISGKICTGKTTLLEGLSGKLKWPTFLTGKVFRDYVTKHDLNLDAAAEQNEKLTKIIDFQVRDLLHQKGKLIVDGWMSGLLAGSAPDVLKVFLLADDRIRYNRFAEREGISAESARLKVEERQSNWFGKISHIHGISEKELTDKSNYDLVIDTSHITPQAVTRKVLEKILPGQMILNHRTMVRGK